MLSSKSLGTSCASVEPFAGLCSKRCGFGACTILNWGQLLRCLRLNYPKNIELSQFDQMPSLGSSPCVCHKRKLVFVDGISKKGVPGIHVEYIHCSRSCHCTSRLYRWSNALTLAGSGRFWRSRFSTNNSGLEKSHRAFRRSEWCWCLSDFAKSHCSTIVMKDEMIAVEHL
jgi:hypothetical protein